MYVAKQSSMDFSAKQAFFNWVYTAFEIPGLYFPEHPKVQENMRIFLVFKSYLEVVAPLRKRQPKQYVPITNKNIAWLRSKLENWVKQIPQMNKIIVSKLKGRFPGHSDLSTEPQINWHPNPEDVDGLMRPGFMRRYFLEKTFDPSVMGAQEFHDLIFLHRHDLIFFYRPDDYRDAKFQCTTFEKQLLKEAFSQKKEFVCNLMAVEFALVIGLLSLAEEKGDKFLVGETYEFWYIIIFVAIHYGELLEKLHTGFYSTIRQRAREFVKAVKLLVRPDEELDFAGKYVKQLMFKNHNMARTRDLVQELKAFLKE